MKKHHIIFLSKSYYPNIGGVEKHVYELSKELVRCGHKVTIVTEDKVNSLSPLRLNDYEIKGVQIIRIPTGGDDWFKKFRIWKWIWENREIFIKADLSHCHDVFYWYLPIALLYPLKPVYTTFHGYEGYPVKLKAIIYRKIFEIMSNKTICVGDFMRKWYHANPTRVIYGAVNPIKKSIRPKKNSAIFIGRLDEHTGIDVYAQAVSLIRKKIPDFTLTVYGDGPYKEIIKGEGIILKGENPSADTEIPKYEYAFVSRYLAMLEAMAAKRLVIALYDNPVKKDYLLMTPYKDWIVRSDNANNIASIILNQSNSYSKKFMVSKSYDWIINQSWNSLAEEYIVLWQSYEK
jgi:glycosyltransferase involved in cell wall biosynthesis